MPVREFASRVAAGELRGETVIVNAEIVAARGGIGETAPCPPPGPCLIGVLATGVGVSPGVFANYVADIDEGDGSSWSLSFLPSAPQTGVAVLSVDQEGRIIFVGRNPPEEVASVLSEIPYVDFDLMPLEEIRVVPAWLTGIVAPISCAPPEPGTYIADLPGRYCGNPSWLAPDPLRVDPNGYTMPDDALQVQSNAYLDFARSPAAANGSAEPRAGLYVIAKRLEGSGCPDGPPPCWQWEIIGRVTINDDRTQAQPLATPTPAAVREIACTPQGSEDPPTIVDEIGIVDSCQVFETRLVEPFPNPISVRNPDGDDHVLEVHWSGNPCDIETRFTLWLVAQRAHLDGVRPDVDCDEPLVTHHMRVVLTEPLLAETVTALLSSPDAPTPPTPTTAARFECVGPPLPPGSTPSPGPIPAVIDETGLVQSCGQTDYITELTGTVSVSNPFENNAIEVIWEHGICDAAIEFTFRAADDGKYDLTGDRPTDCARGAEPLPMYIRFSQPMPAEQVTATILDSSPGPTPTPPALPVDLGPAWWELAPTERPTDASTELDLLVYERECANGESPEGRVSEPEIEYGDLSVTITFQITPLVGGGDCPAAPGAPVTVRLGEPLGDRRLVDGGFASSDRVIQHDDNLLWVFPLRSLERATARLAALLGPDACPETIARPRPVDEAHLEQLANDLGEPNGMLDDGLAWVGSLDAAVPELGGFELYQDLARAFYMVGFAEDQGWLGGDVEAGDLVLADITSLPISGGRTIWIVGRYHQTFGSSDCQWESDNTPAVGPRADDREFDFTVSISAPSASWTTGPSLEGFGAALEYSGARDPVDLNGSGSGLAFAYWTRLDGEPATPVWAVTEDCARYQFKAGERQPISMVPSPGFSQNGNLMLPVGIWRLTTFANFLIGDGDRDACTGQRVDISASIIVRVR